MRLLLGVGGPTLEEPADLARLAVVSALRGAALDDAARLVGVLTSDGSEVLLDPDRLRSMGPADDEWLRRFGSMLESAARAGWIDPAGRIRAHLETLPGPAR